MGARLLALRNRLLTKDWMLSELILNKGFTKEQLASSLQITPQELNAVLMYKTSSELSIECREKLNALYSTHHIKH